nr:SMC-Scp complex subunit ScpB [Actibacterium sp. 188UL27-1]
MVASPVTAMEILIEDSTLGFEISVGERQVRGTFDDWFADIDFDRREISIVVQMASTTTGGPLLDAVTFVTTETFLVTFDLQSLRELPELEFQGGED